MSAALAASALAARTASTGPERECTAWCRCSSLMFKAAIAATAPERAAQGALPKALSKATKPCDGEKPVGTGEASLSPLPRDPRFWHDGESSVRVNFNDDRRPAPPRRE